MDAWCMDFVFSDSPAEAARYDNKKGLDYHLPVTGSSSKEPPMHIMHVAVEMAPIAKVGGLADVVTSISRAIIELGHTVEVVLPKYDCLDLGAVKNMRDDGGFQFGSTGQCMTCVQYNAPAGCATASGLSGAGRADCKHHQPSASFACQPESAETTLA